jgi:hypothetical protein
MLEEAPCHEVHWKGGCNIKALLTVAVDGGKWSVSQPSPVMKMDMMRKEKNLLHICSEIGLKNRYQHVIYFVEDEKGCYDTCPISEFYRNLQYCGQLFDPELRL